MQPFRRPPAVGQFSHDAGGSAFGELAEGFVHNGSSGSSDPCDVFQPEHPRSAIFRDAENFEEKPAALATESGARAGNGQVLAWESRADAIHRAAERPAWEGFEIVPDRSSIQSRAFHPCHESGRCVGVPLNVSHGAIVVAERVESRRCAFVEHADASAE